MQLLFSHLYIGYGGLKEDAAIAISCIHIAIGVVLVRACNFSFSFSFSNLAQ